MKSTSGLRLRSGRAWRMIGTTRSQTRPCTVDTPLGLTRARHIDDVCVRFEAVWRDGPPPRIEDFLTDSPDADRAALLRELVRIEAFHRRRSGDVPATDDYRPRFAEFDPA